MVQRINPLPLEFYQCRTPHDLSDMIREEKIKREDLSAIAESRQVHKFLRIHKEEVYFNIAERRDAPAEALKNVVIYSWDPNTIYAAVSNPNSNRLTFEEALERFGRMREARWKLDQYVSNMLSKMSKPGGDKYFSDLQKIINLASGGRLLNLLGTKVMEIDKKKNLAIKSMLLTLIGLHAAAAGSNKLVMAVFGELYELEKYRKVRDDKKERDRYYENLAKKPVSVVQPAKRVVQERFDVEMKEKPKEISIDPSWMYDSDIDNREISDIDLVFDGRMKHKAQTLLQPLWGNVKVLDVDDIEAILHFEMVNLVRRNRRENDLVRSTKTPWLDEESAST